LIAVEKYIYWRHPSSAQRLGRKSRDKTSARPKARNCQHSPKCKATRADTAKRLFELVQSQGVELIYSERIGPAKGLSHGGKITLLSGMKPAEEFSTLVHEIGHLCGAETYVALASGRT
jgi:hypothetical protein